MQHNAAAQQRHNMRLGCTMRIVFSPPRMDGILIFRFSRRGFLTPGSGDNAPSPSPRNNSITISAIASPGAAHQHQAHNSS